jgi:GDP-L-fucose synthase
MSKILVTGGSSMIGKAFIRNSDDKIYAPCHEILDLTNAEWTKKYFEYANPDSIVHLASLNGNIAYNAKYPADIYQTTVRCGINVLSSAASCENVKKVLCLISSCAYPDVGNNLLVENNFWNGSPNPTVEAHGFAKRTLLEFGRQLYKQHGLLVVGMVVNTVYGPYDNFNPDKTKVVGSLIKKFYDATVQDQPIVTLWGTGKPRREFVFCEDVGRYMQLVLNEYDDVEFPINIGCGVDYEIGELAEIIAAAVGYGGKIMWDTSRPDGQQRKLLCTKKREDLFGNLGFTGLEEGIKKTVRWFLKQNEEY